MTEDKGINPWYPSCSYESQQLSQISSQSSLSLSDLTSSNSSFSEKSLWGNQPVLEPKEKEIDYLYFNHENLDNHCHRRIEKPNDDNILEQTNQDNDNNSQECSDTDSIASRNFQEELRSIYDTWKDGIYPMGSFPFRPLQTTKPKATKIEFKQVLHLLFHPAMHNKNHKNFLRNKAQSRCYTRTLNINPSVNKLLRNLDRELQDLVANAVYGDNSIIIENKKLLNCKQKQKKQDTISKVSFEMEQVMIEQRSQSETIKRKCNENIQNQMHRKTIFVKDHLPNNKITYLCLI